MDKNIWWSWAVKNIVCVLCWCALAIVFDRWWISLFSILFVNALSIGNAKMYYRICDKCGKHSPLAESYNGAIEKAKESGWEIKKVGDKWDDRCPDCKD